jgi:hypothetical protein
MVEPPDRTNESDYGFSTRKNIAYLELKEKVALQ